MPQLALSGLFTGVPTLKYNLYLNLHLFKHAPASFTALTISDLAKLGLVQTTLLSRTTRNYCFISETNARDHHEPWNIFTWPLAGLYLNEKEGLKEGSMAAGFRGVEVCFAAAWLMPHLCFVEMGRKRLWWGCQWWEGSFDLLFWGTDQSLEEVILQLSSGNLYFYFLSSTSVQATLKYIYSFVSFCLFKTLKNLF